LLIRRGMLNLMPRISFWWFILRACNMAAPPSLNLLCEFRLLNRLVSWSWVRIFLLIFYIFLELLILYTCFRVGLYYSGAYCCSLGYSREFLLLFLYWFPLNFFIMKSDTIIFWI
jgi:hypothetical protein